MIRALGYSLFAFIAFFVFASTSNAQTINAASCSASDVQSALNSVTASTTLVVIPACSGGVTWNTQVTFSVPSGSTSLTIQGQSVCTSSGTPGTSGYTVSCADNTKIVDGYSSTNQLLVISNINNSTLFRITGISLYTNELHYNGTVSLGGSSSELRIDHNNWQTTTDQPGQGFMQINGCMYGVADHNLLSMPNDSGSDNGIRVYNAGSCNNDSLGIGDQTWAQPTRLGSANFFFIEDNEFVNGAGNDCYYGRFVWRYNTSHVTYPAPPVQTHATGGAGRWRGCRAWEIYDNYIDNPSSTSQPNAEALRLESGTGVVWGNTVPSSSSGPTGYQNFLAFHSERSNNATYSQTPTPAGWGYCGTSFTGIGSNWDENLSLLDGHACLDNIGRGVGSLLVGGFTSDGSGSNNVKNNVTGCLSTQACGWPNQAQEPVYEWMDSYSSVPGWNSSYYDTDSSAIAINRDFYVWCNASSGSGCTSFNGTQGVGSGTLASRPSTCTTLVAYWATDANTLYQCSSTNTWTAYYTPYTYPHPLDTTTQTSGAPVAPTGLQAALN